MFAKIIEHTVILLNKRDFLKRCGGISIFSLRLFNIAFSFCGITFA